MLQLSWLIEHTTSHRIAMSLIQTWRRFSSPRIVATIGSALSLEELALLHYTLYRTAQSGWWIE